MSLRERLRPTEYPRAVFGKAPLETIRYFPDKLPIGVDPDGRRYVFLYCAAGQTPMDFRLFLLRHAEQCRWQVAKDAELKEPGAGLGDGWLRLMMFDMSAAVPRVHVRTYSTYYQKFSSDLPEYAEWYMPGERPTYLAEEFLAADDFTFELTDFSRRFGKPVTAR